MQIDEFLELVRKRRSIRGFTSEPVPDEAVQKILEAGRWAMSGANAQPWELIVVTSQETKERMAKAWTECQHESDVIEMTRVDDIRHEQHVGANIRIAFKEAPVLIVVCGDRRTFQATVLGTNFIGGEGGPGATFLKSMANITHTMQLAVAASGLASMWRSVNRLWEQELRTILGVPVLLEIHTIVALGHPSYKPRPSYRRELKEFVHYEKFDKTKFRSGEQILDFVRKLRSSH